MADRSKTNRQYGHQQDEAVMRASPSCETKNDLKEKERIYRVAPFLGGREKESHRLRSGVGDKAAHALWELP